MLDQSVSDVQKKQGTGTQIKSNVFQMIQDVFEEMAVTHAEREEVASTIASARAQAAAGDDYEDNLDSVGADEDAKYEAFLKSSLCPL